MLRKKKIEAELRRKQREKKKADKMQRIEQTLCMDEGSDDAMDIDPGKCYQCEEEYDEDNYIQCEKCIRRFHLSCVEGEMLFDTFECKYC